MSQFFPRRDGCPHCAKLVRAQQGQLSNLILEREHSILVVGDHQFFPGYCMVISKHHAREMHDLPSDVATAVFQDAMQLGAAMNGAFSPWKINYASLGNIDEHLHWHVIPRYTADNDHRDHPWKNSSQFSKYASTPDAMQRVRQAILSKWNPAKA